jgi:hypothetical protein
MLTLTLLSSVSHRISLLTYMCERITLRTAIIVMIEFICLQLSAEPGVDDVFDRFSC